MVRSSGCRSSANRSIEFRRISKVTDHSDKSSRSNLIREPRFSFDAPFAANLDDLNLDQLRRALVPLHDAAMCEVELAGFAHDDALVTRLLTVVANIRMRTSFEPSSLTDLHRLQSEARRAFNDTNPGHPATSGLRIEAIHVVATVERWSNEPAP